MSGELEIIELREELQRVKLLLQNCNGDIIRADREIAALKNALRELLPLAEFPFNTQDLEAIDRAKKLLDKQPQSESDGDKNL